MTFTRLREKPEWQSVHTDMEEYGNGWKQVDNKKIIFNTIWYNLVFIYLNTICQKIYKRPIITLHKKYYKLLLFQQLFMHMSYKNSYMTSILMTFFPIKVEDFYSVTFWNIWIDKKTFLRWQYFWSADMTVRTAVEEAFKCYLIFKEYCSKKKGKIKSYNI